MSFFLPFTPFVFLSHFVPSSFNILYFHIFLPPISYCTFHVVIYYCAYFRILPVLPICFVVFFLPVFFVSVLYSRLSFLLSFNPRPSSLFNYLPLFYLFLFPSGSSSFLSCPSSILSPPLSFLIFLYYLPSFVRHCFLSSLNPLSILFLLLLFHVLCCLHLSSLPLFSSFSFFHDLSLFFHVLP